MRLTVSSRTGDAAQVSARDPIVFRVDRRRLRLDHRAARPRVLARERVAIGERQRVVRHPLDVPLLEGRICPPQHALDAPIRHRRQQRPQVADDEHERGTAEERCANSDATTAAGVGTRQCTRSTPRTKRMIRGTIDGRRG